MVIVDTPPVLVVNDAMVIARSVDGLRWWWRVGVQPEAVQDLRHRFESAAVEPIGLVWTLKFYSSGYGHYAGLQGVPV